MHAAEGANPDSVEGAPPPRSGVYDVNGTRLYAEMRGSGPVVLLIGASDEDAEFFRPIAERLSGRTVVTYDRRGCLRSGRDGWPGGGSAQHADDAVALLDSMGFSQATVFGASAGGIVALRAVLRHPDVFPEALVFEPGLFLHLPDGEVLLRRVLGPVERHLASNPDDWVGAVEVLGQAIADEMGGSSPNFFTPPPNREWYVQRAATNAEALIREDLQLTLERVSEAEVAACPSSLRLSFGANSLPLFERLGSILSAPRGTRPDRLDGVGHAVYYTPDVVASYILDHSD